MKNKIVFAPIGQGGGNIVDTLLGICGDYNALFINTSKKDLDSLKHAKHTYHIPYAEGCGKERKKAVGYAQTYYKQIIAQIMEKFSSCDIVIFVATMAGGTGSGITPPILGLAKQMYPNKHFGFVGVLPKATEDIDEHMNAIACWNDIMRSTNEGKDISIYLLDNNKREKESDINKEFAILFNDFMNMSESHAEGVVDEDEISKLLTMKKSNVILEFDDKEDIQVALAKSLKESIFAEYTTNTCEFMGISTTRVVDVEAIKSIVGYPRRTFKGYNSKKNIVVATGIEPQKTTVQMMNEIIEDKMKQRREVTSKSENMIIEPIALDDEDNKSVISSNEKEISIDNVEKEIDINDFFSKYM